MKFLKIVLIVLFVSSAGFAAPKINRTCEDRCDVEDAIQKANLLKITQNFLVKEFGQGQMSVYTLRVLSCENNCYEIAFTAEDTGACIPADSYAGLAVKITLCDQVIKSSGYYCDNY